eukprot:m.175757 g.175757  ORF g.175757 m.175757 type:complete len:267 (+) comp17354_c0_seq1:170-970(+)
MQRAGRMAVRWLGRVGWADALAIQEQQVAALQPDMAGVLLLCEHPATFTVGRRAGFSESERSRLQALGAQCFDSKRGGQTTFHGPGQLVGYPIFNLKDLRLGVREYVQNLEHMLVRTCSNFNVKATLSPECHTGVWVADGRRKVAAIGVQVSHGITSHGFALNCNTDLTWFSHIIPCGLADKQATSLTAEAGRLVSVDDALPVVVKAVEDNFFVVAEPADAASADIVSRSQRVAFSSAAHVVSSRRPLACAITSSDANAAVSSNSA